MPVAFVVGWLALHWGHTHVIMFNYRVLNQQMHGESSLQIICTKSGCSHSGHVSDALRKTKEKY